VVVQKSRIRIRRANTARLRSILSLQIPVSLAAALMLFLPAGTSADAPARASPKGEQDVIEQGRRLLRDGRYGEAESLMRKGLAEAEVLYGASSIEAARALDLLVESLCKGGKAGGLDAARFSERAVEIKKGILGAEHPDLAVSLRNLGVCFTKSGDYAKARPFFEEALELQERSLGPEHLEVAQTLNDFGVEERRAGIYARAKDLFLRAIRVREASLGPDDPLVAQSLNGLGAVFFLTGDYAEARTLLERALGIDLGKLGPDHVTVSNDLNQLGALFIESGDYAAARRTFARALEIKEKVLDPRHPHIGAILNNLGLAELHLGNYTAARPLLERALAIQETALGEEHPEVAHQSRNNLARLSRLTGDYATAERLYRRSLAFQEKALGPSHPHLAETLTGLGKALKAEGRYSEAENVYRQSVTIHEQSLGAGHPFLAGDLQDLSEVVARLGKSDEAMEIALRAEEMGREHASLTVRTLPEDQALRYATVRGQGLDVALSLIVAAPPQETWLQKVWDAVIRSRALVLDEMASRNRAQLDAGDPEVARLNEQLASVRARLAKLIVRREVGESSEPYPRALERVREERESVERELAEKSAVFRREQERVRVGFENIRNALPAGSALVAYVAFNRFELPGSPRAGESQRGPDPETGASPSYLAWLLAPGRSDPQVFFLGPAPRIEALVEKWRTQAMTRPSPVTKVARRAELQYRAVAEDLRRAILDPVAKQLGDVRQVFIVPDGTLHLVNFAALPVGTQGYLVEQGPTLHYLSAERDLATFDSQAPASKGGLLVIGGPAYDATSPFAALTAARLPSAGDKSGARSVRATISSTGAGEAVFARPEAHAARPFRGAHSSCSGFRSMVFEPLPASSHEVTEIASLWRERAERGRVVSLTGGRATEAAVKEMAGGFAVLHLATHGFFLGDCPSVLDTGGATDAPGRGESALPSPENPENPFLLAGLALAGANHRSSAGPEEEDGILTSEEIASLDLSGVNWVVLSACDTGLGKIQVGEGVFGLRRSFETAGAKTLLLSLWPLDDQAAREWMRGLYRGHLEGLPTPEAVRGASLEMIRSRRRAGRSTHPFFWGPMVASGDWR